MVRSQKFNNHSTMDKGKTMKLKEKKNKGMTKDSMESHPQIYVADDPYKEKFRYSDITIRITSFGSATQHKQTVQRALAELHLAGITIERLDQ